MASIGDINDNLKKRKDEKNKMTIDLKACSVYGEEEPQVIVCPECKSTNIAMSGGCMVCMDCGYSPCG